jgi:hypothetical protein
MAPDAGGDHCEMRPKGFRWTVGRVSRRSWRPSPDRRLRTTRDRVFGAYAAGCSRAGTEASIMSVSPPLGRLPNIGPNAVALAEAALGVAARAGFPDPPAVVAALHDQVVGAVLAQAGLQHARSVAGGTGRLAAYLATTAERHPAAAAAMRAGAADDDVAARSDQRFAFSLDCLLDGLATRLPEQLPTKGPLVGT